MKYLSLVFSLLVAINIYGQGISINSSKDSLYLSDDFDIDGAVLTNENGSTGIGWSDNWKYQAGNSDGVVVNDGYIYCTKGGFGITRTPANPIKFVGSTYYVSFLFKKNRAGNFRISGCRYADGVDRFGIHIKEDGKLGVQAGTAYANTVVSSESFVENDKTYLVVAKYYYTTKPNMNISVYSVNDNIPADEPSEWDFEVEGMATGMVAIEYFRLAFTAPTVNIDEFKLGDTWKSVTGTDVVSAFPEPAASNDVNSDVQKVDQAVISEKKSWTYTISEPGNYQIGFAWIWVNGKDKEVDLEVKSGGKIIKAFTAKSAIAPYRFETRLENLAQGDEIQVTATPKSGASYRLSYRLAYATPTFEGLPAFDIASYGAVGDGVTNDYQSIQNAIAAAKAAGGGIVRFDGSKTYYIAGPPNYALFDLSNTSNIKVEGNGANIVLYPTGNFIRMDNSENIHIDGFTTTYNPLPYYQGKITAINVNELYLDMQVNDRYDTPKTGKYVDLHNIFGRSFWVTIPGTKMGEGRHLSVDSTAQIGDDDHAIRVFLQDHESDDLSYSKSQNATDYIIPHIEFGHEALRYRDSPYCKINRSSRVKISNILTHSVCHFAYTIGGNFGPITFSNTDFLVPNEEDMHIVWRDGWHVWGNRYGIMIEDGNFDAGYTYDDIFSPHSNVPIVESVSGKTVRLKSKPSESYEKYTDKSLWQVGDLVSFWNENQTFYYGMARVTEVSQTANFSLIDVTLDSIVDRSLVGSYAINEEIINRDMVVRNCTTTPKGRNVAVRQRTPILYKDCDFQNIHFYTYCGEPWRTRPRNVVFDNCFINERMTFNVDDAWNVIIKNCTINGGPVDISNCPNIIMDSIYFTNIAGDAIQLRAGSNANVFGMYTYNGDPSLLKTKYNKDISSTINFSQPEVYPNYAPPFLLKDTSQDLVYIHEPFDIRALALSNAGSGVGWAKTWTSSNEGLSIDENASLSYPKGVKLNSSGGRISENQNNLSNERIFAVPVSLASGTFYLSFLAKKSSNGSFKIETNNALNYSRFGIGVMANGFVSAKSGTEETLSNSQLFKNDSTYFFLVKFTNTGGNSAITRVKLYKSLDELPADDTEILWDVESNPVTTGVDQDRLIIKINSGTVELDEILIGNTFKSVTYDENYVSTNLPDELSTAKNQLVLQNRLDGVNVIIPCKGGRLTLYDSLGRRLFSSIVYEDFFFIEDAVFKNRHGVSLIQYQINNRYYEAKAIR